MNPIEDNNNYYKKFSHHPLCQYFDAEKLQTLFNLGQVISLQPGDYLVREGDVATDLFLILEGDLDVVKHYQVQTSGDYTISTLRAGDLIGEVSLFDNEKRSASVRCATPSLVFKISYTNLHELVQKDWNFTQVLFQTSRMQAYRLRAANKAQIELHKIRETMGNLVIMLITLLCLYSFILSWMSQLVAGEAMSTLYTLGFGCIMLGFIYYFIKSSHLPLKAFGITTENWRQAVYEGIVFSIPALVLVVAVKAALLYYQVPGFAERGLFDLYYLIPQVTGSQISPQLTWLLTLLLYTSIEVPMQELAIRGGLQGPLQMLLTSKHKQSLAIFSSNLMFSTFHLYHSTLLALLVFIPGLFFGWLYARHRTLIGPIVSHIIIGAWAMWIVQF